MTRERLHIRRFLDRKGFGLDDCAIALVEDTSGLPDDVIAEDRIWYFAAWLTIRSGDASVRLDFGDVAGCPRERENALRKADLLVDTCTRFRDALRDEARLAEARSLRRNGTHTES